MSDEEPTTDRHDESDSAQFGDDPHHLADTPFEESACPDCGTYTVKAKGRTTETRCLEHARTHAGITWPSGHPTGTWHPTIGHPPLKRTPPNPTAIIPNTEKREWQWGCIECKQTGPADSAYHATQLMLKHQCPPEPT